MRADRLISMLLLLQARGPMTAQNSRGRSKGPHLSGPADRALEVLADNL